MTRSLRAALVLFAALGIATTVVPSAARADCPPNSGFCAGVQVRGPVVVTPARGAQVIITVGPAPQIPPPPPVVMVQPPPPPVVIYRPQPPVVMYRPQPVQPYPYVRPQSYSQPRNVAGTTGLRFFVGGAGGGSAGSVVGAARLGGVGGALRLRPTEKFAIDLGVGFYGGTDYNGRDRVEIPLTADALFFVNPQNRVQFYLLGGVGASFAYGRTTGTSSLDRNYTYVGVEGGGGLEFRLTRGFALNVDARAFLRSQPNGTPEFQRTTPTGTETTRVSGGVVGTAGATLYF